MKNSNHQTDLTSNTIILIDDICFGYVTESKVIKQNETSSLHLTFETAPSNFTSKLMIKTFVRIYVISYIRVEIATVSAVYDLAESPLRDIILNPRLMIPEEMRRYPYVYKGVVSHCYRT